MNKLFSIFMLSAIALTIGSLEAAWGSSRSSNQSQMSNQDVQAQAPGILYIQTAREAVIERDLGESKGTYTLTLKGVQPNIVYFANESVDHMAGKVPVNQFINNWSQGDSNALQLRDVAAGLKGSLVTTATTPSNVEDVVPSAIILSQPIYDAKSQELKFTIRNIDGSKIEAGRHANPILFINNR